MARFAYDVNTTQRVIDVHKQFKGGLKTIDTDDALGAVFLRDAENVSLSEFGFIEKRYGTVEKFQLGLGLPLAQNTKLQGYWEFLGKYIIVALNGYLYWQLLSDPDSPFKKITAYEKDDNLKYPTNIPVYEGFFQSERPMGAVILSRVMYVFTGKYPVYLTEENNQIRSHFFSKEEPIFAELVVTGHNLLEDDYDALYYQEKFNEDSPGIVVAGQGEEINKLDEIEVKSIVTSPGLPYAQGGTLDFDVSYNMKSIYNTKFDLAFDSDGLPVSNQLVPFYRAKVNAVKLRPSGPGATNIEYQTLPAASYTSSELNNVTNETTANVNVFDLEAFSSTNAGELDFIDLTQSTPATTEAQITVVRETQDLKEAYYNPTFNGEIVYPRIEEKNRIATFTKQDITIVKDDIPSNFFSPGRRIGFHLLSEDPDNPGLNGSDSIDFEESSAQAKAFLNSFLANGSFKGGVQSRVIRLTEHHFGAELWLETVDGRKFPLFQKYVYYTEVNAPYLGFGQPYDEDDIGGITIEYRNIGATRSTPGYALTDWNGDYVIGSANIYTGKPLVYAQEDDPNTLIEASSLFDFQRRLPMFSDVRDKLNEFRAAKGTTIELHQHNSSDHTDNLIRKYTLQDGIEIVDGKYFITLPDSLDSENVNDHFEIIFNTVQLGIETTADLISFYNKREISPQFLPNVGYFPLINPGAGFANRAKDFYPFISEFYRPEGGIKRYPEADITTSTGDIKSEVHFSIFEQLNFSEDLAPLDDLGSANLKVQIKQNQLLSGTYDFLLEFILERKQVNSSLILSDISADYTFSGVAKSVTITEERLSDFEFFEDADSNATHPIWSCNQVIEHFDKLLVWGSEEMPTSVFYSFPDRPFYFPSKFYLEFANRDDNPVNSVVPFMNILVVQTEEQTWGIRGNSGLLTAPSPYAPFPINSTVGTIAPKSVRPVRNHLFFLSKQGVIALKSLYAADEQYNIEFVDRNIRNIVPQDSDAVGVQFDNQYWLNFPNYSITLRWYIDKKAWVQDKYGAWSDFKGVFKYLVKNGKLEFITWPSTFEGDNKIIYKIGVDEGIPSDLTKTISSKFETSFLNQNYPFHQKNYKETKLDFSLQNEYSSNVSLLYNTDAVAISNNIHTIDADELELDNANKAQQFLESHTYSLTYDDVTESFTTYDADFDGQTFTTYDGNYSGQTYSSFDADYDFALDSIRYINTDNEAFLAKILTNNGETITFVLPVGVQPNGSLEIAGNYKGYSGAATIKDVTFDETLTIKVLALSESGPLNIQDFSSYEQTKASVNFDFGTQFNDWTFGTSGFGNKVSSVNTIKLAGKGYNAKLFLEETSKTKWTLESLGLTYKMKRARSR